MTNRRKDLQWILLETVFHFIRGSSERMSRYEELKSRKGANTAKVIMARQMLKVIYHVLKEQRPYYRDAATVTRELNPVGGSRLSSMGSEVPPWRELRQV